MKNILEDIKQAILSSKKVIVAGHIDPDGDSLGSMIGLALIIKKLRIDCIMYSHDGVPNTYKFLPQAKEVLNYIPNGEFDLLITVDSSDLSRIGKEKVPAKKIINIDHHPDNTNYGAINCVEMLSSVAEQIYKLARHIPVEIDHEIATALYVSIITDTGNFRYSNTLPSTFAVAKELVCLGANPYKIANDVYDNKRLEGLRLLAKTLSAVELLKQGKVIYSIITQQMFAETGARGEDLIGIIDQIRSVKNVEVAILFREEEKDKYKINFRSKGMVNVSTIARALGGGGHVMASGCQVTGDLGEIKNRVLDLVLKEFK